MTGMCPVGKDYPVASAFPLPLVPAPWAPDACQDWEVVHWQEILRGRAGDRSNLREGVYLRWMENRRKEAALVHGNSMDGNLKWIFFDQTRTKIHFWRTVLTIDLIIVALLQGILCILGFFLGQNAWYVFSICYIKVTRAFYFGNRGWWGGAPIGSSQMWNIPGLPWGKIGKFPPFWMGSAARKMTVAAGLIPSKNHLMPFQ